MSARLQKLCGGHIDGPWHLKTILVRASLTEMTLIYAQRLGQVVIVNYRFQIFYTRAKNRHLPIKEP